MESYGSLAFTVEYAEGIAGAANDAYEAAFENALPGPDRDFIRDLIPYMLTRRS